MTKAAPHPNPSDGITVVKYSLRCFGLSLGGLMPILGVPFIVQSFSYYRKARATTKGFWNPAGKYLLWGGVIGSAGLLITIATTVFIICAIFKLLPWQYENQ